MVNCGIATKSSSIVGLFCAINMQYCQNLHVSNIWSRVGSTSRQSARSLAFDFLTLEAAMKAGLQSIITSGQSNLT